MGKITFEERELLSQYSTKGRSAFIDAFCKKFEKKIPPRNIYNRASYLWDKRELHVGKVNKEIQRREAANHTVMIPARISTKATPARGYASDLPDVGELIVKQNHLIAESVVLQKEIIQWLSAITAYQKEQTTILKAATTKTPTNDAANTS